MYYSSCQSTAPTVCVCLLLVRTKAKTNIYHLFRYELVEWSHYNPHYQFWIFTPRFLGFIVGLKTEKMCCLTCSTGHIKASTLRFQYLYRKLGAPTLRSFFNKYIANWGSGFLSVDGGYEPTPTLRSFFNNYIANWGSVFLSGLFVFDHYFKSYVYH